MSSSRVLTLLAALAALICAWFGLAQSSSFALREEVPALYWPQRQTQVMRCWLPGQGMVQRAGRSAYEAFEGGGPGEHGK